MELESLDLYLEYLLPLQSRQVKKKHSMERFLGQTQDLLNKLNSEGMLSFEGKLNGKFVKFHSRIIDCRDEDSCVEKKFIQAGITDITESILLKRLLYLR